MSEKAWKDPIVEEISQIRKKLDREFEKDPKRLMEHARSKIIKAGFKIVPPPLPSKRRKK